MFRLALDKLLPLAEERGVVLALEPMNGDCGGEFTFLNCFDETLDLIQDYNSGRGWGSRLDTYHWGHQPLLIERLPQLTPHCWHWCSLATPASRRAARPIVASLATGTIPLRDRSRFGRRRLRRIFVKSS